MSCIGQSAASHNMATPTMKNRFWLTVVTGSLPAREWSDVSDRIDPKPMIAATSNHTSGWNS